MTPGRSLNAASQLSSLPCPVEEKEGTTRALFCPLGTHSEPLSGDPSSTLGRLPRQPLPTGAGTRQGSIPESSFTFTLGPPASWQGVEGAMFLPRKSQEACWLNLLGEAEEECNSSDSNRRMPQSDLLLSLWWSIWNYNYCNYSYILLYNCPLHHLTETKIHHLYGDLLVQPLCPGARTITL